MTHVTMTVPEKWAIDFITLIREYDKRAQGRALHVRRFEGAVGPLLQRIHDLPGVVCWRSYTRQVRFAYKGAEYKVRYSHLNGGQLEIVRVYGHEDGPVLVEVRSLREALDVNLQDALA